LIEIRRSPNRPHHLIRLGAKAGVFVRIGPTNRRADPVLIEELKRYGDFFQPVRKLARSNLKTLKLTTSYQGRIVPTIGDILRFGVDRFDRFPYAWIQAS
jgi:ATP-dependent DNA helicase RecG